MQTAERQKAGGSARVCTSRLEHLLAGIKNGVIVEVSLGLWGLAPNYFGFIQPRSFFGSGVSTNSSKAAIGHDDFHRFGAPGLAAISASS